MSERFDFSINYSQLIVSDEPAAYVVLQDWTEQDGERGFSWKPGSVSFGTLGDVGDLEVEVRLVENFDVVLPEVMRAVVVPLAVSPAGRVVLSDCIDDETISIPPGEYSLPFEIGWSSRKEGEEAEWCRLTFVPGSSTRDRVLKSPV